MRDRMLLAVCFQEWCIRLLSCSNVAHDSCERMQQEDESEDGTVSESSPAVHPRKCESEDVQRRTSESKHVSPSSAMRAARGRVSKGHGDPRYGGVAL